MNPRKTGGPKEGDPGDVIAVTMTDIVPFQVFMVEVQDDGYFSDGFYAERDRLVREYQRKTMRGS